MMTQYGGKELERVRGYSLSVKMYRHRGVILVLVGSLFSALQSICVKLAHENTHVMQVAFVRYVLQITFPVTILTFQGVSPIPRSMNIFIKICARSLIGMLSLILIFFSFYNMPVGNATAIVSGSPVFVGVLGWVFLKEAFGIIDGIMVFVAIGGIFMISQPPFLFSSTDNTSTSPTTLIGPICAIIGCVGQSLCTLMCRHLGLLHANSFVIVVLYAVIASFGMAVITTALGGWSIPPCGTVRFALVGVGLFNAIYQCLITYSLTIEKGFYVSILRTNEILFAFVLEYFIFDVSPNWATLVGVVLILFASIMTSLNKHRTAKRLKVLREKKSIEMEQMRIKESTSMQCVEMK